MSTCLHAAAVTFRKATASGGNNTGPNCVEVGPFFKAAASNPSGNCVEISYASAFMSNGNGGNNCVEVGYAKAEASAMGGNCVEVGPARTATKSAAAGHCVSVAHAKATGSAAQHNCVEPGVAADEHTDCTPATCKTPGIEPGDIVVRDSKLGEASPLIVWKAEEWRGYVANVVAHGMERGVPLGFIMRHPRNPGIVLLFHAGEADAFRDGCTKGEFNYSLAGAAA